MIKIQMRLVPSLPSVAYKFVSCELHLHHLNNCHKRIRVNLFRDLKSEFSFLIPFDGVLDARAIFSDCENGGLDEDHRVESETI